MMKQYTDNIEKLINSLSSLQLNIDIAKKEYSIEIMDIRFVCKCGNHYTALGCSPSKIDGYIHVYTTDKELFCIREEILPICHRIICNDVNTIPSSTLFDKYPCFDTSKMKMLVYELQQLAEYLFFTNVPIS